MSTVEKTVCDHCGKETDDAHTDGWVRIVYHLFRVSAGRDASKKASNYWVESSNNRSGVTKDFCCVDCLVLFLAGKDVPVPYKTLASYVPLDHEPDQPERLVVARYQACVSRLLNMFPSDPLPEDCEASAFVERLEALLDHRLVGPHIEIKNAAAIKVGTNADGKPIYKGQSK